MKEEWLMPGAIIPVDIDTTKALVDEIKRLIGVIGGMALQAAAPVQEPVAIDGNTSDGYHTFNELYDFRKAYNVALFNEWAAGGKCSVHKSWRHHDGELCFGGGWFIVVAVLPQGQISNHYEAKDWDLFAVPETERVLFEFDGHSGSNVVARLKAYTTPPAAQPIYDQTSLELCNTCGWKTLIPGDGCLNCEREAAATSQKQSESAYQRGYMDGTAKGRRDAATDAAEKQSAERVEPVACIEITHHAGLVESWRFAKPPLNAPAGIYDVYTHPAPAAPVQEPVEIDANMRNVLHGALKRSGKIIPPPAAQRQWVGLTDEERGQAINANFGNGLWHMAKDIEAKLKEKNTGETT